MPVEIVWTSAAERDLLSIHQQLCDLIEDDATIDHIFERPLESCLRLLRQHSEIAPRVRGAGRVRRSLFGPKSRYGLFYIVEQRGILIHAVLDMRQNPADIIKRIRGI